MHRSRSPLRAAFWAMVAAFGLSLFLLLSDPHAVRQSILAGAQPPARRATRTRMPTLVAEQDRAQANGESERTQGIGPLHGEESEVTAQSHWNVPPTDKLAPESSFVAARSVSAGEHIRKPIDRDALSSRGNSTMPIVPPSQLTGSRPRGEYVELPPPPESGASHVSRPVSTRQFLESDDRFGDRLSQQLQNLENQQTELLLLQQVTLERLTRLAEETRESSQRIEAIVDQRQAAEFPQGPSF